MINENWMRSISQSYKNLTEQQMMMPARPMAGPKRFHHPFRTSTAGPIQDQGPASVEPPKPNPMFPGPGAMGEVPGPQGKPIAGTEQSVPMMGMGQPQQPQIQIAQMGRFKQPFGEVPGQLGQMPQMGQMSMGQQRPQMPQRGMGQPQMGQMGMGQQQMPPMGQMGPMGQPVFGAPGQNIQQALSNTRPITKIEPLENRDVPDEFRYAPAPQQQQGMPQMGQRPPMGQQMPQMGQMGQRPPMGQMGQMGQQMPQMGQMGQQMPQMGQMGQQMPQMGQMGQQQTGMGQQGPPPVPSIQKIKSMMKKIGQRGLPKR